MASKTQFRGSGSTVQPQDQQCPSCRLPTQGRPFCAYDGTLINRSFAVADRYVMSELLGVGGTALVFGGHDKVLGRPVALKVLRPQLSHDAVEAQRFLRAARLSSQLQHENIVVVHDCGEDRELGFVFVVMERLLGNTLAELRSQSTRLTWQRSVPILIQICRALTESHRLGIIHRDLGLRNVTLTTTSGRSDVVKLCDFGLARSSCGDDRVTSTGTAVGTPAYMAPEQIRGDDEQDHRIDLYGLGVIAYEMLSARLPHEAATTVAMIASKLTTPPMPLSERCPDLKLPAGIEPLIMRCLAAEPRARPESAADIERELLNLDEAPAATAGAGTDLVGQHVGHYRVLERLNQGGMGQVYVVEHNVLGTKAALKVLLPEISTNPEAVERFIQEARASGEIGSAHIARCYDFGYLPDKRAYVLMELVDGDSVATQISLHGPLALAEVKQIVRQTTDALAAAHAIGIIHRDIKPDHILLSPRPDGFQVKVLDFGIAKVLSPNTTKTEAGVFMGTPLYCAPEQVLGGPVGPATDIYALGATIYEMLTGRPPFSGELGHVLAIKTQRDPISILELRPALPPAVAETVEWMMARDRSRRPLSMRAVATEVAAWPEHDDESAAPARRRWLVGRPLILACVATCALVGSAVALWPRADADPARMPAVSAPIAPAETSTPTPSRVQDTSPSAAEATSPIAPPMPTTPSTVSSIQLKPAPTPHRIKTKVADLANSASTTEAATTPTTARPLSPQPIQPPRKTPKVVDPFSSDVQIVDPFK